uniref:N-acetylneuraminate lyase-like isoform X1 n=2 Tax=Styela clava TaxID=7725 RepID=UPI0019393977|nr:N-acetylneuraminate lyase-like isoform X1 [Styela clava]XP_039249506.1 N-acetylneuraminate lyase-like isoform X1 [Styela clava]
MISRFNNEMKLSIEGLIVAPCTPMHEDGSINVSPIAEYAVYLKNKQCVDNIFVCGTTGEGQNLTIEERKKVGEEWVKQGRKIFKKIIIHVGAGNLAETQDLAKHATEMKADAVAIAPPTYFKPASVQILGDYLASVAKVVPDIPVLFYHLPERTGADFAMLDLLDNVVDRIPNFAGMKFVTFNMGDFGRCQQRYGDRVTLSFGKDEALLFAALSGGTSFVGATFNYMGSLYKEMFDLFTANDIREAMKKQQDIQVISGIVGQHLRGVTERISGIKLGPSRLPIAPVDEDGVEKAMKSIKSSGLMTL